MESDHLAHVVPPAAMFPAGRRFVRSSGVGLLRYLDDLAARCQSLGWHSGAQTALHAAVLARRALLRPEHPETWRCAFL